MKLQIPVIKNEMYEIYIDDLGVQGQGIGKIDGYTVFVENALPNERIKIVILKVKKSFAYGKIVEIIEKSKFREEPFCENFIKCGGCQIQHLRYNKQLEFKRKKVIDCIERIAGINNIYVDNTIGMVANNIGYRNKAQFPVGVQNGNLNIGFYSKRSHNIININKCYLQNSINDLIIKIFRDFIIENNIKPYDEKTHTGIIRHIITRIGYSTNEIMICIVCNCETMPFVDRLIEKFSVIKDIKSIVLNENKYKTNVILGDKTTVLYGKGYITDYIGDIKFKISPLSFFQVNPIQTEIIYNKILEISDVKPYETVLDIYCGIGTISLFFAKKAKYVIGVEVIPESIKYAKINSRINNFNNTRFEIGSAEYIIPKMYTEENIYADIVVVDPPRKGCDINVIDTIINIKPKKIIYLSCEPSTLARDLKYICSNNYYICKVIPFDQFPHTHHIESCVLLKRI